MYREKWKNKKLRFFRFVQQAGTNEHADSSDEHQVICPGCRYGFTVIHECCEKDYDGTEQDQVKS
jgi:hypothetical protein